MRDMLTMAQARWVRALFVALVMAAAGCTTNLRSYSGPDRSAAEVARLKVQFSTFGPSARIESIDGKSIQKGRLIAVNAKEIALLPGEHTLEVSYRNGNLKSLRHFPLTFTCQAGGVYELHVAPINEGFRGTLAVAVGGRGHWTAWITDAATQEVLAGVLRPDPLRWYER